MRFQVNGSQRETRVEFLRLIPANIATGSAARDLDGVEEGTYQVTVNKEGTGDYSITFDSPFVRKPVVVATALHASSKLFCTVKSNSTTACRIIVHSDAGTATDPTEIHVMLAGFDTADQI